MEQLSLSYNEERLFEEITSQEQLRRAYKKVRSNRGVPGVDNVSVEDFGEHLEEELRKLGEEVRGWTYKPNPVKRVRIPKPGSNKERLLGIPCVRDRVLQYSMKMSLERCFEKKFSKHSYGFRPGRSQKQAVSRAQEWVKEGREWVIDLDLENFFDGLNHDRIIHQVRKEVDDKRVLRLIGLTLRSGVMEEGRYERSEEGTVQGSPLSPLLSNIVLHELDTELEKRGLAFCRWADDCNVYVRSRKAAERVKETITQYIETKLKLKVNKEKSHVGLSRAVKFLGMTIVGGMIIISPQTMGRAMEKVKELTPRRSSLPLEQQIARVTQWYKGWSEYYSMTETPSQLKSLEAHIRARFRAQFMRDQKRRRYLVRKLIKQGTRRHTAMKVVYSNDGIWRMSHSFAANSAWNIRWFKERGLATVSEQQRPHWQSLDLWIKLT